MNNPTLNGACNWNSRVKAEWKKFPPSLGRLIKQEVLHTPNGMSYGPVGFTPCDHALVCTYERGSLSYDGQSWTKVA